MRILLPSTLRHQCFHFNLCRTGQCRGMSKPWTADPSVRPHFWSQPVFLIHRCTSHPPLLISLNLHTPGRAFSIAKIDSYIRVFSNWNSVLQFSFHMFTRSSFTIYSIRSFLRNDRFLRLLVRADDCERSRSPALLPARKFNPIVRSPACLWDRYGNSLHSWCVERMIKKTS